MTERVLVVGGGMSGLSACTTLALGGVAVECVFGSSCETELSSGAWDDAPWTSSEEERELSALLTFLEEHGLVNGARVKDVVSPAVYVATAQGVIRATKFAGCGIMDVSRFAGRKIGVLDVGRPDFDATWLSRSFSDQPWSRRTGTSFVPLSISGIFDPAELQLPQAAFGRIFDDMRRVERAQQQLVNLSRDAVAAFLGGPWLGTQPVLRGAARRLTETPTPWLETLHGPDGSFGERYCHVREALLGKLEVPCRRDEVVDATNELDHVNVEFAHLSTRGRYRGVVLCQGGLFSGGVRLTPTERGKHQGWMVSTADSSFGGELAGWDPAQKAKEWLYSSGAPRVSSEGRITRVQAGIAGVGSLGGAAQVGHMAARHWLSRHG